MSSRAYSPQDLLLHLRRKLGIHVRLVERKQQPLLFSNVRLKEIRERTERIRQPFTPTPPQLSGQSLQPSMFDHQLIDQLLRAVEVSHRREQDFFFSLEVCNKVALEKLR